MEVLGNVLPVLLYFLGSILLIVLIILGIKLIQTIDKANALLDDVENKVKTLNGFFNMVDSVSGTLSVVGERIVDNVTGLISSFLHKRRKKKEEKENDLYE